MAKRGSKKGFTLIEMVVVLGIIAILSLIGVWAAIAARNQALLDSAVNDTLSALREAQSKSMGVAPGPNETASVNTVGWSVRVEPTAGWSQNAIYYTASTNSISVDTNTPKPYGVSQVLFHKCSDPGNDSTCNEDFTANFLNIDFMAPFGKSYTNSESSNCTSATADCFYGKRPTLPSDWIVTYDNGNSASRVMGPDGDAMISITFVNSSGSESIYLKSNGDMYAK